MRLLYRGAEPIKGFAVYAVPQGQAMNLKNATLIKILVADKTVDINLTLMPAQDTDRLFISAVDKNNVVSDWVQVR